LCNGSDTRVIQFLDLIAKRLRGAADEAARTLTSRASTILGGQVSIFDGHIEFDAAVNFTRNGVVRIHDHRQRTTNPA